MNFLKLYFVSGQSYFFGKKEEELQFTASHLSLATNTCTVNCNYNVSHSQKGASKEGREGGGGLKRSWVVKKSNGNKKAQKETGNLKKEDNPT